MLNLESHWPPTQDSQHLAPWTEKSFHLNSLVHKRSRLYLQHLLKLYVIKYWQLVPFKSNKFSCIMHYKDNLFIYLYPLGNHNLVGEHNCLTTDRRDGLQLYYVSGKGTRMCTQKHLQPRWHMWKACKAQMGNWLLWREFWTLERKMEEGQR